MYLCTVYFSFDEFNHPSICQSVNQRYEHFLRLHEEARQQMGMRVDVRTWSACVRNLASHRTLMSQLKPVSLMQSGGRVFQNKDVLYSCQGPQQVHSQFSLSPTWQRAASAHSFIIVGGNVWRSFCTNGAPNCQETSKHVW